MSSLARRRASTATAGAVLLLLLIAMALAAPWLTARPPERQLDPVAGRNLPPMSQRFVLELADGRWLLADSVEVHEGVLTITRLGRTQELRAEELAGTSVTDLRPSTFVLGTDKFGRDLWSRIAYGARVSLAIGLAASALSLVIGILVGAAAAMSGGWIDTLLMRLVDGLLMFPRLFLILALSAMVGASLWVVIVVLGLTGWMSVSRLMRAELLRLRESGFALAARAIGQHPWTIFTRHLLPAALSPVLVDISLRVGAVILIEAALSFLGQGVQPPTPSWGNIIADGSDSLTSAWWVATFPGLAISVTVIAFNLLGDGLRDRLDPRRFEGR